MKQEQLDRIEALLRQRMQTPTPSSAEGITSQEANLPPLPEGTRGYVFVKLENEFLRSYISEIKEDIRKMKTDIWKIKGHVQHTFHNIVDTSNLTS